MNQETKEFSLERFKQEAQTLKEIRDRSDKDGFYLMYEQIYYERLIRQIKEYLGSDEEDETITEEDLQELLGRIDS